MPTPDCRLTCNPAEIASAVTDASFPTILHTASSTGAENPAPELVWMVRAPAPSSLNSAWASGNSVAQAGWPSATKGVPGASE